MLSIRVSTIRIRRVLLTVTMFRASLSSIIIMTSVIVSLMIATRTTTGSIANDIIIRRICVLRSVTNPDSS